MLYWAPYGRPLGPPTLFNEPESSVLIGRISCSFSSSFEVLFSFPLRYLFAIDHTLSYLALDGQHHLYSVSTFKLTYSQESSNSQITSATEFNGRGSWVSARCTDILCLRNQPFDHRSPSSQGAEGFSLGLLPFRSQLLGESLLISFPPLTYMLKFSG